MRWTTRGPRRLQWLLPAATLVVLLAAGGWLAWQVTRTAEHLDRAHERLTGLRLDRGLDEATANLRAATADTSGARAWSSGPLWRAGEHLPWLGDDLRAVRVVAASADRLVDDVASPLLNAAAGAPTVRGGTGGAHLKVLRDSAPTLRAAANAADAVHADVTALDTTGLLPAVAEAVSVLGTQAEELASTTELGADTAGALPGLLGVDGPRQYFLAFQNPAEARGTGGLVGVFGVLRVDDGRMELLEAAANDELPPLPRPPVDLGAEYTARYGHLASDSRNANLSPHFPYAARLLLGHYRAHSGKTLDGVVAVDPFALARLLEASGPVRVGDEGVVTADDVVPLTLSEAYQRFPDSDDRTEYLLELVRATFAQLTAPSTPDGDLLRALGAAAEDRRLLVYSDHRPEQAALERLNVAGALPPPDTGLRAVIVNSANGSKLDYYLDRDVRYRLDCPRDGRRVTRLRVSLTNGAPNQLPPYVLSHLPDLAAEPATQRLQVSLYLPGGTGVHRLAVNGRPAGFAVSSELGYDVLTTSVDVRSAARAELVWDLDEPDLGVPATLLEQPLVRPATQTVHDGCGGG